MSLIEQLYYGLGIVFFSLNIVVVGVVLMILITIVWKVRQLRRSVTRMAPLIVLFKLATALLKRR